MTWVPGRITVGPCITCGGTRLVVSAMQRRVLVCLGSTPAVFTCAACDGTGRRAPWYRRAWRWLCRASPYGQPVCRAGDAQHGLLVGLVDDDYVS